MRTVKAIVSGSIALALCATGAFGQQISSTNKAPAEILFPNSYGKLTLRQYHRQGRSADGNFHKTPSTHARLLVGSTFFNDRVDVNATFGTIKDAGTTQVTTRRPEYNATWTAVKGPDGYVEPFISEVRTATQGESASGKLGIETAYTSPTGKLIIGDISAKVTVAPYLSLVGEGGAKAKVRVEDPKQTYSLAENPETGDKETPPEDLTRAVDFGLEVGLANLARVKGLSVTTTMTYTQSYAPDYVADKSQNDEVRFEGYSMSPSTETVFDISYAVSENFTLSNTTYANSTGFYEEGYGATDAKNTLDGELLNRTMLTYKLW